MNNFASVSISGEQQSQSIYLSVWSMKWTCPDVSASVTNMNLNLVANLTSLQKTWLMLFTPWWTCKRPLFSIGPANTVASMGLKDALTSIWCKVTDANTLLEFKIEPKMINCNLCSFNILWHTWTFFSRYRNLKTPTTILAERKQKNWTLLGQNMWVKQTLQCTDYRLVLAPKIQLVCEENVTTAENAHSLYSSIDGSNSWSIMRFHLCWPPHEWKPGAPPCSDLMRADAFTSWARLLISLNDTMNSSFVCTFLHVQRNGLKSFVPNFFHVQHNRLTLLYLTSFMFSTMDSSFCT